MPPLRPILPASQAHSRDMRRGPPIKLPPKHRNVSLACETCRQRKVKVVMVISIESAFEAKI